MRRSPSYIRSIAVRTFTHSLNVVQNFPRPTRPPFLAPCNSTTLALVEHLSLLCNVAELGWEVEALTRQRQSKRSKKWHRKTLAKEREDEKGAGEVRVVGREVNGKRRRERVGGTLRLTYSVYTKRISLSQKSGKCTKMILSEERRTMVGSFPTAATTTSKESERGKVGNLRREGENDENEREGGRVRERVRVLCQFFGKRRECEGWKCENEGGKWIFLS